MMITDPIGKIKENSSQYLEPTKSIDWGRSIGSGMYGTVSEVVVKQKFALKQIELKKLCDSDDEKEIDSALLEVHEAFTVMNKNLRNVVRTYQYYYDERMKNYSYTMDILEMDLFNYIVAKKLKTEAEYLPIFDDIVSGRLCFTKL